LSVLDGETVFQQQVDDFHAIVDKRVMVAVSNIRVYTILETLFYVVSIALSHRKLEPEHAWVSGLPFSLISPGHRKLQVFKTELFSLGLPVIKQKIKQDQKLSFFLLCKNYHFFIMQKLSFFLLCKNYHFLLCNFCIIKKMMIYFACFFFCLITGNPSEKSSVLKTCN